MLRVDSHQEVAAEHKMSLAENYADLNPAAIQRQIQSLTAQLLAVATSKVPPLASLIPSGHRPMSHRQKIRI